MTAAPETTTVDVTVIDVLPVRGPGKLVALANAEIEIDGVVLLVQGARALQVGPLLKVEPPQYRDADGRWYPAVILPDEIGREIARQIGGVIRSGGRL